MRRTISRKMQKGRVGVARRLTNLKAVERVGRCNSRDRFVIGCFLREACKQTPGYLIEQPNANQSLNGRDEQNNRKN